MGEHRALHPRRAEPRTLTPRLSSRSGVESPVSTPDLGDRNPEGLGPCPTTITASEGVGTRVTVSRAPRPQHHDHREGVGTLRAGHCLAWRACARRERDGRLPRDPGGRRRGVASRRERKELRITDMEVLTSAPKLSFDTGGEFMRQTRRRSTSTCPILVPAHAAERRCMPKASSRSSCCSARG